MQELDAFEKYLQDQLKGHAAPQELMWKRLNDAIGKPKAWYAKSIVKYALTALTAAFIGAGSTYVLLQNKTAGAETPLVKSQSSQNTNSSPEKASTFSSSLLPAETQNSLADQNQISTEAPSSTLEPSTLKDLEVYKLEAKAEIQYQEQSQLKNNDQSSAGIDPLQQEIGHNATLRPTTEASLTYLKPISIQLDKKTFINKQPAAILRSGFSIQLANTKAIPTLEMAPYVLNSSASHTQAATTQQRASLQVQYHLPKSWVLGLGIGQQQLTIAEQFYKTNVYSYDDKEHYLFNYAFGQRKISDEELEDGPWPSFPPNPFGSDTSHVHTNYQSDVRINSLQIPISFGYERSFGKFALQLTTGITLNHINNAQQTLLIPGYSPSTINIANSLQRWSLYQQQRLRFEYLANRHLGIYLEPTYMVQIKNYKSVSGQGVKLNQMQLQTGISWKF